MTRKMDDIEIDQLFQNGVLIDLSPLQSQPWISKLGNEIMIVEHTINDNGGTSVVGVQTRPLNTVQVNTITGASLAANQITLPAGTYRISGSAPCYRGDGHIAYLYNVTDGADAILGTAEYATNGIQPQTRSFLSGVLTINAPKVFELRHFITTALALQGLGKAAGGAFAVQVYAHIEIWKQ